LVFSSSYFHGQGEELIIKMNMNERLQDIYDPIFWMEMGKSDKELGRALFHSFETAFIKKIEELTDSIQKQALIERVQNLETVEELIALCEELKISDKHSIGEIVENARNQYLDWRRN